jgi:hypothetical protein
VAAVTVAVILVLMLATALFARAMPRGVLPWTD